MDNKAANSAIQGAIDAVFKTTDVYAPSRPLPLDEYGVPIPDTDVPHTQLRTRKKSSSEEYPQAREFDKDGNPVRDIDFTDHKRPGHPNPHQHERIPNPNGETLQRDDPTPLPNWDYN